MRIWKIALGVFAFCTLCMASSTMANEPKKQGTLDFTIGGLYSNYVGGDATIHGRDVNVDDLDSGGFFGRIGAFVFEDVEVALAGGMTWSTTEISTAGSGFFGKWAHVFKPTKGSVLDADVQTSRLGSDLIWNMSGFEILPGVNPYLGLGGGVVFFDVETDAGETDGRFPEVHGIIGLRTMLNDNTSVVMEYQPGVVFYDNDWVPDDSGMAHHVFVGMTIFFD